VKFPGPTRQFQTPALQRKIGEPLRLSRATDPTARSGSMPIRHFSRGTMGSLSSAVAKCQECRINNGLAADGRPSGEQMGDPSGSFTAETRPDKVMPAIR
jgi:hypothetical protein